MNYVRKPRGKESEDESVEICMGRKEGRTICLCVHVTYVPNVSARLRYPEAI